MRPEGAGAAEGSSERVKVGMGCEGRLAEALGVVGLSGSSTVGGWIVGGGGGGGMASMSRRALPAADAAPDCRSALPLLAFASLRILGAVSLSGCVSSLFSFS